MSRITRTRRKFRYPGDPSEVKLEFSKEEAYELADALIEVGAPNGQVLKDFLEDSENSDADLIKLRHNQEVTQ